MKSNLSKTKLSLFSSLSSRKMRDKNRLFIIEGAKGVGDTLGTFPVEAIVVENGVEPPFDTSGYTVYECDSKSFKKISTLAAPTGLLAVYRYPETIRIPEIHPNNLYLLLDGIQDPGNLGTIIRTAHWFGITDIFASSDTVEAFNPKTLQASMGSIAKVNVTYCDLAQLIEGTPSMPVYGTLLEGRNLYAESLPTGAFIVMGNEGKGISDKVKKLITNPITIPPCNMENHPESLNVATATAITLSRFRHH